MQNAAHIRLVWFVKETCLKNVLWIDFEKQKNWKAKQEEEIKRDFDLILFDSWRTNESKCVEKRNIIGSKGREREEKVLFWFEREQVPKMQNQILIYHL